MPKLILRYADNQPQGYPTTQAAYYFAQLVEQRTQGNIRVRIYANGELGNENSVLEQVRFGGIDLCRVSVGTLTELYPELSVLQLPYLYQDADHMWRVLDGPIGQDYLAKSRRMGVFALSWFDAGVRSVYTTERIDGFEDFQGRLIRVQESEFMSQVLRLLGAEPIQIPYSDVYSALQTGKIDGAENNWASYQATGHFSAAPYVLLTEHIRIPEMQVMSTVALDEIAAVDEDYVTIVRQCARESALYERELWRQTQEEAERYVHQMGCQVTRLSQRELDKFRGAVQPIYDGCGEEQKALIQRIRDS